MVATQETKQFPLFTLEHISKLQQEFGFAVLDVLAHPESDKLLEASKNWVFDEDPVQFNPELGISVASAFYGDPLDSPEEIYKANRELMEKLGYPKLDEIPNLTETSGFPVLRQMTPGLRDVDYLLVQQLVARELITNALNAQELTSNDVDLLLVATSIPITPDFYDQWRRAADIPDEVPVVPYCMACNSSGQAIDDLHARKYDELIDQYRGKISNGESANVVLFALDDANREADKGGDPSSSQLFSTGASAMVFKYHPTAQSSMRMIVHESKSIEKGANYLKVRRPYDRWTEEQRNKLRLAKYLHAPDHGGPVDMAKEAGVIFKNYGIELALEVVKEYEAIGYNRTNIKKIVMHHPSGTIFKSIKDKLTGKYDFDDDQLHWVINEGNVPVATIPIALGRQLEDLSPGDHVMILSYGAGGEYTCQIVEMGRVN